VTLIYIIGDIGDVASEILLIVECLYYDSCSAPKWLCECGNRVCVHRQPKYPAGVPAPVLQGPILRLSKALAILGFLSLRYYLEVKRS